MSKSFYITTTLPYVNADPHVGFAMELIRADVIARAKKLQGYDVFFNTGTDEHGSKLFKAAEKEGVPVKQYVDGYAETFRGLADLLDISADVHFIRTTDAHHEAAAQEFWNRCTKNGFIYKKTYQIKYCIGCELEKTDSELVDGQCPIHPTYQIELIDEENYFFKFSAFQKPLLDFYAKNPTFVIPDFRFNEIKAFIERGLEDFSISRLKSKMPWGIAVPGDDSQVMYVWFDALVNYISTLGWPQNLQETAQFATAESPSETSPRAQIAQSLFDTFWVNGTPTQYCGKDNLRQQSAMWQAMLMAAELPNSHQIVINGFFTGEGGLKMSKSIGNVVNPYDVVKEFGVEALRYYVLGEVSMFEDSPVSLELIKSAYNSKLANGLGNLTSRIMKMAVTNLESAPAILEMTIPKQYFDYLDRFEIGKAVQMIWAEITALDTLIQDKQPFKLVKTDVEAGKVVINELVVRLYTVARMLNPILPTVSSKIKELIKTHQMPAEPLFLRKD
jgi:methionyl-tRNA synthetase